MSDVAEMESRAREMGWIPQEEFKGDPEKWVSAEEYVARGEQLLPLVRANNKKLEASVKELQMQLAQANQRLAESAGSMQELMQYHEENLKQAKAAAQRELAARLKQAREEGDTATEVEILGQISDLKAAPAEKVQAPELPPIPADFQAWLADNDWYGKDLKRTALANSIAQELRAAPGGNAHLVGRAFYEHCAAEADKILNPQVRRPSKVEGDAGGRGGAAPSGEPTYDSLPPEAKQACKERVGKMVGDGKPFKTEREWQSYFAKHYQG